MTTPQPDLKPHLQPFSAMTDFEVVERVRNGDAALFELLMRRAGAFPFAGRRCDRIVAAVLARLAR